MGVMAKLFGAVAKRLDRGEVNRSDSPRGSAYSHALRRWVDEDSALTVGAYFACLRNISEDVAKLPLPVYQRVGDRGKIKAAAHPLYPLLHDSPNDEMTSMSLRQCMTWCALGWGNGYAEIERDGRGRPVALWPIHPSRVEPARDGNAILFYSVKQGNDKSRFDPSDILHITGPTMDGIVGVSVLAYAMRSLGLTLASHEFAESFYGNGARPTTIVTTQAKMAQETEDRFLESWRNQHGGSGRAGGMALLSNFNGKIDTVSIPQNEMQFLETRQFQVDEVARWFRMPPHKIGSLGRATWSNIEQQSIDYVTDTLLPWLTRWEQEISRKLFRGDRTHFAEHVVSGLLRGDSSARSNYYSTLFNLGALSPNDIRAMENMNPVAGGDQYFVPTNNVSPLGDTDAADPSGDLSNDSDADEQLQRRSVAKAPAPDDFIPPLSVREEARRGLEWRRKWGRGGTAIGIARARDLAGGRRISAETARRMKAYFDRHEIDKQAEGFRPGEEGYPSNGRIAWALWGGDPGRSWSASLVRELDKDDKRVCGESVDAAVDGIKTGMGRVIEIERKFRVRAAKKSPHPDEHAKSLAAFYRSLGNDLAEHVGTVAAPVVAAADGDESASDLVESIRQEMAETAADYESEDRTDHVVGYAVDVFLESIGA